MHWDYNGVDLAPLLPKGRMNHFPASMVISRSPSPKTSRTVRARLNHAMADPIKEGSLVWIEIPATHETSQLKDFYNSLFPDWKFHDHASSTEDTEAAHVVGYALPNDVHGGVVKMPEGCKTQDQPNGIGMTIYYKVNNLEKTESKIHGLGGKTALGKTKQGEGGWFMNFLDPQGNRFGAYQFAK